MNLERMFEESIREKIREKQARESDKNPRLRMTTTGFDLIHGAERSGVNQEAGLVELLDRHYDLRNVKADRPRGNNRNRTLYIEYHIREADDLHPLSGLSGFVDAKASYFLTIKNEDKEQRRIFFQARNEEGTLLIPDAFAEIVGKVGVGFLGMFKWEYELRTLCSVFDFKKIPEALSGNAILRALQNSGWQILDGMKFHESFTFKAEFERTHRSTIEFGYYQGGDHASLMRVIKLDFLTKLDVVKLSSIKVERKGKDGHSANYVIRADKVLDARKFASAFLRKKELDS